MKSINKIFGIGLSKTGTTSLAQALRRLGFTTIDFPYDARTLQELEQGNFQLSVLQSHQAVTDTPVAIYYAQLDELFPGSKFILTVRDEESWLRSVEEHWRFSLEWARWNPHFKRFTYFIRTAVYGTYAFNSQRYRFVYQQHVRNVEEYFHRRPDDLLVLDVCRGEGYEKLCPFLGLPLLEEPFPRANTKEAKTEPRAWIQQLEQAAKQLTNVTAPGQTILLLDEEQLAGFDIAAGRKTVVFPELAGHYAGRPANGGDAVAALELAIERHRPDYFAVAWPAFWWLQHYTALSDRLQSYPRLVDSENLVVFDIRRESSALVQRSSR